MCLKQRHHARIAQHMNLLAHFYLAELTGTSAAGQLLGDMVKGRLDGREPPAIERGIRLHRAIDSFTDKHWVTTDLRRRFRPPLRRYGGILVDIGFDHCLARNWAGYSDAPLPDFARQVVTRARQEWPATAHAPARPPLELMQILVDYQRPAGLQRALDSVDLRLRHNSPLPEALPPLLDQYERLDAGFRTFFPQLCDYAQTFARRLS